jgi:hypothetical protein
METFPIEIEQFPPVSSSGLACATLSWLHKSLRCCVLRAHTFSRLVSQTASCGAAFGLQLLGALLIFRYLSIVGEKLFGVRCFHRFL